MAELNMVNRVSPMLFKKTSQLTGLCLKQGLLLEVRECVHTVNIKAKDENLHTFGKTAPKF